MESPTLLILGASARAAAFSALRAGLRPWCADLFADADLRACCPVVAVPSQRYPAGLLDAARQAPPGPWMYTGALENRPALVDAIARQRPLWGNDGPSLRRARSPLELDTLFAAANIPRPDIRTGWAVPAGGKWLVKPRAGAGGSGIHVWTGRLPAGWKKGAVYFQEFIEGDPCAAVYVGDGRQAQLLGVTRQLVGEPWLHARPFHYCGSIGRIALGPAQRQAFDRLGNALAAGCRLRGLFGVDGVLRDGVPWPVEVNPRYTASVEILEYTLGVPALALHRRVFDPDAPALPEPSAPAAAPCLGKAILFARAPLVFPADGPWDRRPAGRRRPMDPAEVPAFADIPAAGQPIKAGRPILTFFARGDTPASCQDALRQIARDLDRWLFG
jgi:predicted ATP-grasp superfamily ATP-dependent carboligase